MGFFDEIKKLTRPYDDEDDDFIDEADAEEGEPQPEKRSNPFAGFSFGGQKNDASEPQPAAPRAQTQRQPVRREGRVVSINGGSGQMQVVLVKPERFETAAEIADHLRDRHAIVMNLETTPKDIARRLIDFVSGVAYAQDGKIKKIAANTYIITPYNVDLTGDLLDEFDTSGTSF
jgi:cell division inhibitor SepF